MSSLRNSLLHGCVALFSSATKSVTKPLPRHYPQKLETIGDHLRTKRLDSKLGQKDLESTLGVCQATILLWEKNKVEPQAQSKSKINNYLGYCLLPKKPAQHFGHQLQLFRTNTIGKTIFELATDIGIDEATLTEIEYTNTIRYTSVQNSVRSFLKKQ